LPAGPSARKEAQCQDSQGGEIQLPEERLVVLEVHQLLVVTVPLHHQGVWMWV